MSDYDKDKDCSDHADDSIKWEPVLSSEAEIKEKEEYLARIQEHIYRSIMIPRELLLGNGRSVVNTWKYHR